MLCIPNVGTTGYTTICSGSMQGAFDLWWRIGAAKSRLANLAVAYRKLIGDRHPLPCRGCRGQWTLLERDLEGSPPNCIAGRPSSGLPSRLP
jgi:hypothetical protein